MKLFSKIRAAIREALAEQQPKRKLWNLHENVIERFEQAWAKVDGYRSKMGKTSEGRNHWPQLGHYLPFKSKNDGRIVCAPLQGYTVDGHGAVRRLNAKRDKTMSARQWKRLRMAACRCA